MNALVRFNVRHRCGILVLALSLAFSVIAMTSGQSTPPEGDDAAPVTAPRFEAIPLLMTSDTPLAAYQLTFHASAGDVRIVGLEGGAVHPFTNPPYADPAAIQNDRVVIGDYSLAAETALPSGTFRIATIHVEIRGMTPPTYHVALTAAAARDGRTLEATATIAPSRGRTSDS